MSLDPRVMAEFTVAEGDQPGDRQPELHLIGPSGDQVVAIVAHLEQLGATWGRSSVHLDDEGVDVAVESGPAVAGLVLQGRTHLPALHARQFTIEGEAPRTNASKTAILAGIDAFGGRR